MHPNEFSQHAARHPVLKEQENCHPYDKDFFVDPVETGWEMYVGQKMYYRESYRERESIFRKASLCSIDVIVFEVSEQKSVNDLYFNKKKNTLRMLHYIQMREDFYCKTRSHLTHTLFFFFLKGSFRLFLLL